MGEVISLAACSPELQQQFTDNLGAEFSVRALVSSLKERSLFHEARGVINSFLPPDYGVKSTLTATHDDVYFAAKCELDTDKVSEVADFKLSMDGIEPPYEKRANISISPRGIKALFVPVMSIAETMASSETEEVTADTAANLVYRAIYAKTVGQFVVMQRLLPAMEDPNMLEKFNATADRFYEAKFGKDRIKDFVVRADRLAMCFGGSVMFRSISQNLDTALHDKSGSAGLRIGHMLKMYAVGLQNTKPVDQKRVTFPLVNAFGPSEASQFVKAWFS